MLRAIGQTSEGARRTNSRTDRAHFALRHPGRDMRHILISAFAVTTIASCVNDVDEGNVMSAGDVTGLDEEAMTAKCAAGPTVRGIDVSAYQGSINWGRV